MLLLVTVDVKPFGRKNALNLIPDSVPQFIGFVLVAVAS